MLLRKPGTATSILAVAFLVAIPASVNSLIGYQRLHAEGRTSEKAYRIAITEREA